MGTYVFPFSYQSQAITFPDWVTLFTLCLAPLLTHIVSGAPSPSYLVHMHPKWYDRLCLFNPTSILWRYAAITDRRIRACKWRPLDMAASNALFWTDRGWNGTEDMVMRSLPYCTQLPEKCRIDIFSAETLKTVISTLQGAQTAYLLIYGKSHNNSFNALMGVDGIFNPLSILGLTRLWASFWLSDSFRFATKTGENIYIVPISSGHPSRRRHTSSTDGMMQLPYADLGLQQRYRTTSHWPSILFRALYMAILLGLWTLASIYCWSSFSNPSVTYYATTTSLLVEQFYFALVSGTVIIFTYYFVWRHSTSTIIPCISHIWYKVYSVACLVLMAVIFVISALETTPTTCGKYTSAPQVYADYFECGAKLQ